MIIAKETIESIRLKSDIVSVISPYVSLKKRGNNFIGLCPFHSEKTPSFTVNTSNNLWYCFGCHESGDVIHFISKIEGLSFVETLIKLGDSVGITIEKNIAHSEEDILQKNILNALGHARTYFTLNLKTASVAKDYLNKRGLNEEMIKKFHIGYESKNSNLKAYLLSRNFTEKICNDTGLFNFSTFGKTFSKFSERIIFPIHNHIGRLVGFSGRLIEIKNNDVKYINSETSSIFQKKHLLYGFNLAKASIQRHGFVLIMEGYTDVILAHQYGFDMAVSCMGTAITSSHINQLKHYATHLYLVLDNDKAGQDANERSTILCQKLGVNTSIVQLPNGMDPADVLLKWGKNAFQNYIDQASPSIEFFLNSYSQKYPNKNINQSLTILKNLTPFFKPSMDPILFHHYANLIAKKLGVEETLVISRLKASFLSNEAPFFDTNKATKYEKAEEELLYIIAIYPQFRLTLPNTIPKLFTRKNYATLYSYILDSQLIGVDLINIIPATSKQLLGSILTSNTLNTSENTLENYTLHLVSVLSERHSKITEESLKKRLLESEKNGDIDASIKLLKEIQILKKQEQL